jgi:ABC-type Fe3+-hydroxamate transport system substrate-binding protein
MCAGADTYITQMMEIAGFKNCMMQSRYPAIDVAQMQACAPEIILLSSEPFPFAQKHIDELQPHFPDAKIMVIDGEMFSWYGSRMLHAPKYFATLHHII